MGTKRRKNEANCHKKAQKGIWESPQRQLKRRKERPQKGTKRLENAAKSTKQAATKRHQEEERVATKRHQDADLFVDDRLVVEVKAVREIAGEDIAQILGYLRSAQVPVGMLINFGAPKLYVKRFLMTDTPVMEQLGSVLISQGSDI